MPGIFGVIDISRNRSSVELASHMCDALRHDLSYKDYLVISDHCIMGGSTPSYSNAITKAVHSDDRNLTLVMEGEIFNDTDLKGELSSNGHHSAPDNDAELMLYLYQLHGTSLVHKVNGYFVVAIWDRRNKSAIFINDRVGLHYLYFATSNGRLIFAPEIKALLCDTEIQRTVNPSAVADFFLFGYVLGTKTFLSNIALMPPASIMQYNDGKIVTRRYWDLPFVDTSDSRSAADYREELHHLLGQAVRRQTKRFSKCGVALSGGLDSRIVAGYAAEQVTTLSTFTFGDAGTDEVTYADRVARTIGSEHHRVAYSFEDFAADFDKMVWLMEGGITTSEYYQLAKLLGKHVDVALNGNGGDDLSGRQLTDQLYRAKDLTMAKDLLFRQATGRVLSRCNPQDFFSPPYYKLVEGLPRENFTASLSAAQTQLAANVLLYHGMRNQVWKYFTRTVDLPRLYVRYRYPYFDYDVMDFFIRLPPRMRFREKVYREVLVRKFPKLGAIPLPNRRVSIRIEQCLRPYYGLRNQVGRFLLGKSYSVFKRFSPPESVIRYNVDGYRTKLRSRARAIILEGNQKRGYFNQSCVSEILESHFEGRANNSYTIHKLITFELFHRLFVDADPLAPPKDLL